MESMQISHIPIKRHKTASKMHRAAANNNRKELEELIKSGANIYQMCEESKMTPLAYALSNCRKHAATELLNIYANDYSVIKAHSIETVDIVYDEKLSKLIEARASAIKTSICTYPVLLKTSNIATTRPLLRWLPTYPLSIDDRLLEIHHRIQLNNSKLNINETMTPTHNTYFHLIIASSYETLFDFIINNFIVDYNATNLAGQTPLHFSLLTGNQNFVKFLLPLTKTIDRSTLYKYTNHFNVFELIYRSDFNLPQIFVFYLKNYRDTSLIKFIKTYNLNLYDIQDGDGNNVLHLILSGNTCWNFNVEFYKYLLRHWPLLMNERNHNNLLPIHFAITNCGVGIDVLKSILVNQPGPPIRFGTVLDYDILLRAVRSGELVNLKKFYYLFFTQKITRTPFFINKLLLKLVSGGVDLKTFQKFYSYNFAKLKFVVDHDRILLKIAKHKLENHFWFLVRTSHHTFDYTKIDKYGNNVLLYFCETGSIRLVEYLLDRQCDVSQINCENWTMVHKSVLNRNVAILQMILDRNIKNYQILTRDTNELPIEIALRLNRLQHFYKLFSQFDLYTAEMHDKILIQSCQLHVPIIFLSLIQDPGININHQNANGDTILHLIATPKHFQYALDCKRIINLNVKNSQGQTPIMSQIVNYCDENVIRLLKTISTIDLCAMNDNSNMHLIDYFAQVTVKKFGAIYAKILKKCRYKQIFRNITANDDIKSPLKMSIEYHNIKISKLILHNSSRSYLVSELCYLIENNLPKYVKFILCKFNMDVNTIPNLHGTMLKCNFDMLKYLVGKLHLDLNAVTANQENFLHFGVRSKNVYMVDYMIKNGADWQQMDCFGNTPFDGADTEMLNNFKFLF